MWALFQIIFLGICDGSRSLQMIDCRLGLTKDNSRIFENIFLLLLSEFSYKFSTIFQAALSIFLPIFLKSKCFCVGIELFNFSFRLLTQLTNT